MARRWPPESFPNDVRLPAPWRIALFLLLFVALAFAGSFLLAFVPATASSWVGALVLTLAAVAAGGVLLVGFEDRSVAALGFHATPSALPETLRGVAIGGLLIAGTALLLFATGGAGFVSDQGTVGGYALFLGSSFLFFWIAAAFEEAVFRGYPFQVLVGWIGAWPAIFISAGTFSLLHGQNPNVTPLALVNIFLAGVLLSFAYLRTLSLWFATGVHVGWNWMMAGILDFPVSGLAFDTPLYSGVVHGPDWWTGGDFGPEAGIAGTIILIVGTLSLMKSRSLRPSAGMLAARPLALGWLERETRT
jgi:uncharacterized protein